MLARMLMDVIAGLTALLVPPTVALTAVTVLGQGDTSLTTEGIGGLAGAGATAALFGWYLYYQSAVAEPRREADRAKQVETLTTKQAELLGQQQRDFATLMAQMQARFDGVLRERQQEADRLLEALLAQRVHECPLGMSCPRKPTHQLHREPPSAEGEH